MIVEFPLPATTTKYFTTAMVVAVPFTCNVVVVTHMALIVLAALMLALYIHCKQK